MRKLEQLAFTGIEDMAPDENEYLQMWLTATPQGQIIEVLGRWEARDADRSERAADDAQQRDDRPVAKALIYTEDDLKHGRVNREDLPQ